MWHARYLRAIAEVCFLEEMLKRRPLIVRLFSRKITRKIREQIEKWKEVAVRCKAMELVTLGCVLQRRDKKMSELKHQLMLNKEMSWVPCYLKSEADKYIADLEESHKMEVEQLLMEIVGLKKLVETADKVLKEKGGFTVKDIAFKGVKLEGVKDERT